ncbi:MAG: FAD-dependent oxidoreductase, partial [Spirosomaceae bacterium]|nr:FAD-dependent oxidoreductase [Spirosomataceae bacterium]
MNLSFSRKTLSLVITACFSLISSCKNQPATNYDVVVYGGTSAGIIAAYTAKLMVKSVLIH